MKTERRHELQENELANWLGDKLDVLRPYSKAILGVLVLAVVALLLVNFVRGRNERMSEAGWSAYFEAMTGRSPEAFEEVADTYPGTAAAGWAMQRAADLHLDEALQQLFQDREAAAQEIEDARELLQKILDTTDDPLLQQRATFGLAKCLEAQGDFEEAKAKYEQVVSRWPNTTFAQLAQQRIEQIQQPATRQWYSWFAEQKPARSPLTDPGLFDDLPDLPEGPNLNMPPAGQLLPGAPSGAPVGSETDGSAAPPDFNLDLPDLPDNASPATTATEPATPAADDAEGTDDEVREPSSELGPEDAGSGEAEPASDSEAAANQNPPGDGSSP
jgi:tetratricopeptide (TPR) repeat protein